MTALRLLIVALLFPLLAACSGEERARTRSECSGYEAFSDSLFLGCNDSVMVGRLSLLQQRHCDEMMSKAAAVDRLTDRLHLSGLSIAIVSLLMVYSLRNRYFQLYKDRLRRRSRRELERYRKNESLIREYLDELERLRRRDVDAKEEIGRLNQHLLLLKNENREIRCRLGLNAISLLQQLKDGLLIEENMTRQDKNDIVNYIDSFYNGFASKLRSRYSINDNNLFLSILLRMDFTNAELVIVYDCEENTVYRKRQRLKEHLNLTRNDALESFLKQF